MTEITTSGEGSYEVPAFVYEHQDPYAAPQKYLQLPLLNLYPQDSASLQQAPPFINKPPKVIQACEPCRIKKTKCTGSEPCGRCTTLGLPCVYRYGATTEERIARLEMEVVKLKEKVEQLQAPEDANEDPRDVMMSARDFT